MNVTVSVVVISIKALVCYVTKYIYSSSSTDNNRNTNWLKPQSHLHEFTAVLERTIPDYNLPKV